MINSSNKIARRTLATTSREFLRELANLRDEEAAAKRFTARCGDLFRSEIPVALVQQWAIRAEEEDVVDLSADDILRKYWLMPLQGYVRFLWTSDKRTKQWGIFAILEKFFAIGFRGPVIGPWTGSTQWFQGRDIPPVSACERVFRELNAFTACCANQQCPAPYFFATRRSQKYCSEECAAPAQRQFKNKWWKEHGSAWRAQRRVKKKPKG